MQVMSRKIETAPSRNYAENDQRHNLQLMLASLQSGDQRLRAGVTLVFTSPSPGEGVTHVAQLFAAELARHTGRRTLIIAAERLAALRIEDYLAMPGNCHPTNIENIWILPAKKRVSENGYHGSRENGNGTSVLAPVHVDADLGDLNPVDSLRVSFDNILIDCPPLKSSSDAAVLASSADGVVVVVEAGRTRRAEILNAQRTISVSGGKLLGFVLNKRRYPVPEWLYKRL